MSLPGHFRIVFVLRDIEENEHRRDSDQLSLKPETVKTRLHRARRLMRAAIEKRLVADIFRAVSIRRRALRSNGGPGRGEAS